MSDIVFDRMLFDYLEKKNDQSNRIAAMESEIARLRLTDEEREAVERAADWLDRWQATHGYHSREDGDLATLRGLLERLK